MLERFSFLRRLRWRKIDGDTRAFGIGYLLLLPLYLAPIVIARYLPGLDLPFHLSIVDMLSKSGDAHSPYAPFFNGSLSLTPYAAHYLALRVLGLALPLMTAHKLVVGLYIAAYPLGAAALLDACGRSKVPALLAFPLAYNLTLHYGFVSFALSLPVLLFLLAALTRLLTDESLRVGMWIATALLFVALFLCHLQNYLFGLCAGAAFLLLSGVAWKRRGLAALAFLPSVACIVIWHLTHEFEGPGAEQKKSLLQALKTVVHVRLHEDGITAHWQHLWDRIRAVPVHTLRGFTDAVDIHACRALLIVMAGYLLLGALALANENLAAPRARLRIAGWVALLGAMVAYLGVPHHLREFELMTFYPRFAVLVVTLGLLAIPGSLRRLDGVGRLVALVPALAMTGLYSLELIRHYRYYDQEVADFSAAVAKVPPGGRALGLVFDRQSRVMRIESALIGLPHLYPVLRRAPGSMVPLVYCGMRHMPCKRAQPPTLLGTSPWAPGSFQPALVDSFDYFFMRSPPNRPLFGAAHDRVELLAKEGSWVVYGRKAKPPAPPAPPPAPPTTAVKPSAAPAPSPVPVRARGATAPRSR